MCACRSLFSGLWSGMNLSSAKESFGMKNVKILVAVAVAGYFVGMSPASVTIHDVDREVSASVLLLGWDRVEDEDSVSSVASGIFHESVYVIADDGFDFASAGASQATAVSSTSIFGYISASAASQINTSMTFSMPVSKSQMIVQFTINDNVPVLFSGSFDSRLGSQAGASLMLQGPDGWIGLLGYGVYDDFEEWGSVTDRELLLSPGNYTLVGEAYFDEDSGDPLENYDSLFFIDFDLRFIPAPGALASLAFAGLAASRRRR